MKKLLLITVILINLTGCQKLQQAQMQNIYDQATAQQLKQWDIISRNGSDAEKYIHAGIIAGCYLQAGNEAKYKEWKEISESYNPMK